MSTSSGLAQNLPPAPMHLTGASTGPVNLMGAHSADQFQASNRRNENQLFNTGRLYLVS